MQLFKFVKIEDQTSEFKNNMYTNDIDMICQHCLKGKLLFVKQESYYIKELTLYNLNYYYCVLS